MLASLDDEAPHLVADTVPELIGVAALHQLMRRLLAMGRSLRLPAAVLEGITEFTGKRSDLDALARFIARRLPLSDTEPEEEK